MITILGAGGAIGNQLVKLLAATNQPFRLVGRNPKATSGATQILATDLMDKDQTIRAVSGSSVVHLVVDATRSGLPASASASSRAVALFSTCRRNSARAA